MEDFMQDRYDKLRDILLRVMSIVNSPDTDLAWSNYNCIEDLVSELDSLINRLENHEEEVLKDVKFLFAPTNSLQEISLSNGWGNEFINLSNTVDSNI
jgi:hypothetical protein